MRFDKTWTDEAVLREIGERIAARRLERNLTQVQLAELAGLGRRAVITAESGNPTNLVSFVRILRALDLFEALDAALPEARPTPIELLESHGQGRQRASGARAHDAATSDEPWQWGDEQ